MVSHLLVSWGERLFFKPTLLDWVVIILLAPLSLLFGSVMLLRRILTSKKTYPLPIVSVGNLTVGGSGKTPFVIALASRYEGVTVISRGYGRESRGLIEVSRKGKILTDVYQSGDEPMLMAKSLPHASVIVSEDRDKAIHLALKQGAKRIILDDGFNRVTIKKFEILLFPQNIRNYLTFPAGPFREFIFTKHFADLNLFEECDFKRIVEIENPTEKMLLVTAISNPERLNLYLPQDDTLVDKIYLEDHAYFDKSELEKLIEERAVTSLLITEKDEVKMENFKLPLSVMRLKLQIKNEILEKVDYYIGA